MNFQNLDREDATLCKEEVIEWAKLNDFAELATTTIINWVVAYD